MPKEMLFLCDVYTRWLEENQLPHQCASDILYGKDTMNRLTLNQTYWLENFISTWDIIAQNSQEIKMRTKNKVALDSLIDNIKHTFYYVGAKGDDVDQFEIDQLHKLVDEFASQVTISDSQGE